MAEYKQSLSRDNPGLVAFLLDQSTSMNEVLAGTRARKAEALAASVNAVLYSLQIRCTKADGIFDYVHVMAAGYSGVSREDAQIRNMLNRDGQEWIVPISALPQLTIHQVQGSLNFPVWIEPVADGWTPMCGVIKHVGKVVKDWAESHPKSFPPVIVNVSDGEVTDGSLDDLMVWSKRITSIGTEGGKSLLLNVHLSATGVDASTGGIVFPSREEELPPGNAFARALWAASSEIPDQLVRNASDISPIASGSRLFAFNATQAVLDKILNFGTELAAPQ